MPDTSAPTANPSHPESHSTGLAGRVALVTGSTSGIGLAIATALARRGADIVLNGFGAPSDMASLVADLAARKGVRVVHVPADLSRPGMVAELVTGACEAFGKVDILVNNAGVFRTGAVESLAIDAWNATLSVNLTAAFLATRAVLPGMRKGGWGRVINIASALGLVGATDASAYAASKHAIVGLTRSVALETADAGITVNAICPGFVRTPLIEHEIDAAAARSGAPRAEVLRDMIAHAQPNRRLIDPTEIGALAAFLCSPDACSVTGAAIAIDGGWTAR